VDLYPYLVLLRGLLLKARLVVYDKSIDNHRHSGILILFITG